MSRAIDCTQTIDRDVADLVPGIPSGVTFGNMPQCLIDLLGRKGSFYVPGDQIYPLARQVREVRCCERPSFTSEVLKNGQIAYKLPTECSARHGYTNRRFRTRNGQRRGAVWFEMINTTPEESQGSYEREMNEGMISVWTMTISPAGMPSIIMAPLEYSRLLLESHILLGDCAELHRKPGRHNVGFFSASVPWARWEFAEGKHTFANTVADNGLSIGASFGDGYIGQAKKGQMGAHMVFLKSLGQIVTHIGVGELDFSALSNAADHQRGDFVMMGSSGVGKSQVVEPEPSAMTFVSALEAIRERFPEANFTNVRNDDVIIVEGRTVQKTRALVVDDIAAIFVDPANGRVYVYCLEGGYFLRIDQWDKLGVIPIVDRMAFSEAVSPTQAVWSNVDIKDGQPVLGSFHDLDGNPTLNGRVSVKKAAFRKEESQKTNGEYRREVGYLSFGTASSLECPMFLPVFTVLSLPQLIALAGPALRTGKGTQSFTATGSGWVTDPGFTQAQFTARGPGAVTQDLVPGLSRIDPQLPLFFLSQRNSTVYQQPMLYDALWLLRKVVEQGVDLRSHIVKKLPSRYLGWVVRVPGIDARLTDPYETTPADLIESSLREFDQVITNYWRGIVNDPALTDETRRYCMNLIDAEMPSKPDQLFQLTVC